MTIKMRRTALNHTEKTTAPKRAMVEVDYSDLPPDEESDLNEVVEASTTPPSRRRRRLGRVSIASGLAGLLAVGTLFTWAWYSRTSGSEAVSDQVASDAAVPEAAAQAVEQGFGHSGDSSRSGVRGNLDSAVADENAKEHDASLKSSRDSALETSADETATEREQLMEADLKLVAAQAEKLEAEKKAAEERLGATRSRRPVSTPLRSPPRIWRPLPPAAGPCRSRRTTPSAPPSDKPAPGPDTTRDRTSRHRWEPPSMPLRPESC